MLYMSRGGFTHTELYEMPVYLRNFYFRELTSAIKEESNAIKKSKNVMNKTIAKPNIKRK